jgi:hypothetical protein
MTNATFEQQMEAVKIADDLMKAVGRRTYSDLLTLLHEVKGPLELLITSAEAMDKNILALAGRADMPERQDITWAKNILEKL